MSDIVIDDGPHSLESQIFSVKNFSTKVKPGGLFVIEDVADIEYCKQLTEATPLHLRPHIEILDLRGVKGRSDDILFVIRIPGGEDQAQIDRNESFMPLLRNPEGLGMDMMAERLYHLAKAMDLNEIKTIIDVGSAHGYESLNMARVFGNAMVYGFEPTPEHYAACMNLLSSTPTDISKRIHIENLALNDSDGPIKFYPLDEVNARSNNTGMASKFKLMDPFVFPHELNLQKEITVDAVRLDTWCKSRNVYPDLIWMDAQGAELDILRGAVDILDTVKVIMTEAALKPYYEGHTMKVDIDAYLRGLGFVELVSARKLMHEYEVDAVYIRS
jgi:FkbM family methyltransferase